MKPIMVAIFVTVTLDDVNARKTLKSYKLPYSNHLAK